MDFAPVFLLTTDCFHRITLSARASTLGGTFRFWISDCGWFDMAHHRFWIAAHRITRSALASTFGGIVNPICFAVLRLMTNSNLVGCSTGKSAGFAPFKILSTYEAARRNKSVTLTP